MTFPQPPGPPVPQGPPVPHQPPVPSQPPAPPSVAVPAALSPPAPAAPAAAAPDPRLLDDSGPVVRARVDDNGAPLLDVPRRQVFTGQVGEEKEMPVWHPDHESKPPPGSTQESLLVFERGVPVRVAGPTHYHQLADGRVMGGYSGGTEHDDGTKITRIIGIHQG
jgi:hypothetical protein